MSFGQRLRGLNSKGTTSDRDPIGATVTVRAGGRELTQQLTAGDGYQASNQRQLVFGLGNSEQVDAINVRWLSGETQTLAAPPIGAAVVLIEGRDALVVLPAPTRS